MTSKELLGLAAGVTTLLTLVGTSVGVLLFLDERHQAREAAIAAQEEQRKKVLEVELGLREEIVNRDIKKDAEARHHYNSKKLTGTLDAAEEQRLEYLEEQLELKYEEQKVIQAAKEELKK